MSNYYTTVTLLPTTVYGTASGNYDGSSQLFYSDPVRAANYYGGQGSIQTATISTTGFQGNIRLQATLNDQPSIQAAWFEISAFDNPSPITTTHTVTITGNFTFIRTEIDNFDAGTINSITLTF
jgi:hypothetical protein